MVKRSCPAGQVSQFLTGSVEIRISNPFGSKTRIQSARFRAWLQIAQIGTV
jgi:hypothetical protein